jgi:hypothetical protein
MALDPIPVRNKPVRNKIDNCIGFVMALENNWLFDQAVYAAELRAGSFSRIAVSPDGVLLWQVIILNC